MTDFSLVHTGRNKSWWRVHWQICNRSEVSPLEHQLQVKLNIDPVLLLQIDQKKEISHLRLIAICLYQIQHYSLQCMIQENQRGNSRRVDMENINTKSNLLMEQHQIYNIFLITESVLKVILPIGLDFFSKKIENNQLIKRLSQ